MTSKLPILRKSSRRLLLRTYCWGLIPVVGMAVYLSDGGLFRRSVCGVTRPVAGSASSLASSRGASPRAFVAQLLPQCCSGTTSTSFINPHSPAKVPDAIRQSNASQKQISLPAADSSPLQQ